jgi:mannose-1-phosphate guanylyltransferase
MFIWRADRILDEIQNQMPDLYQGVKAIQQDWFTTQAQATVERVWDGLRNVTIDYGVMENAHDVIVLPATGLGWSDIGSWDSFYDLLPGDENGNIVMRGDHLGLDTAGSLVYSNQQDRLIVTIGVENLVVVDTGDVLLVCNKAQVQKVRQVVAQLKENSQDYL